MNKERECVGKKPKPTHRHNFHQRERETGRKRHTERERKRNLQRDRPRDCQKYVDNQHYTHKGCWTNPRALKCCCNSRHSSGFRLSIRFWNMSEVQHWKSGSPVRGGSPRPQSTQRYTQVQIQLRLFGWMEMHEIDRQTDNKAINRDVVWDRDRKKRQTVDREMRKRWMIGGEKDDREKEIL